MSKRLFVVLGLIALNAIIALNGAIPFSVIHPVLAATATVGTVESKPTVTVDRTLSFRALKHAAYLEFRWKRYPKPAAFAMYTIVRSEPDGPTAPEEGDVVATTTNRYSTNAEDHPPHKGTYYYRLCITEKDGDIVCTKAVKVLYEGAVTPVITPPTVPLVPIVSLQVSSTAAIVPRVVPVLDADVGEMELSLAPSASSTILTWTPTQQRAAPFQKYILVRSFTNASLAYPIDGYLAKILDITKTSFLDSVYVDPAMYNAPRWYRVCSLDVLNALRCGRPAQHVPTIPSL